MIITDQMASQLADLFRAMSDTKRIRLVYVLSKREWNVKALANITGVKPATVSYLLRDFRQTRLVRYHRQGRRVFYYMPDLHAHMILHQALLHVRTHQ